MRRALRAFARVPLSRIVKELSKVRRGTYVTVIPTGLNAEGAASSPYCLRTCTTITCNSSFPFHCVLLPLAAPKRPPVITAKMSPRPPLGLPLFFLHSRNPRPYFVSKELTWSSSSFFPSWIASERPTSVPPMMVGRSGEAEPSRKAPLSSSEKKRRFVPRCSGKGMHLRRCSAWVKGIDPLVYFAPEKERSGRDRWGSLASSDELATPKIPRYCSCPERRRGHLLPQTPALPLKPCPRPAF